MNLLMHPIDSKAGAIIAFTKGLSHEVAPQGIRVNCIAPGYFETDMAGTLKNHPVRGPQILERIPCGRWGDPDELKGLAVFLGSRARSELSRTIEARTGDQRNGGIQGAWKPPDTPNDSTRSDTLRQVPGTQ